MASRRRQEIPAFPAATTVILGMLSHVDDMLIPGGGGQAGDYKLPDTGQHKCYDGDGNEIAYPAPGERFYGWDAQYQGAEPAFRDNGDGVVTPSDAGCILQFYVGLPSCLDRVRSGAGVNLAKDACRRAEYGSR